VYTDISFDDSNIAWKSDRDKNKNQEGDRYDLQWADVENQHFLVWMRTAGLPTFRKLYASIDSPLEAGTYKLTI